MADRYKKASGAWIQPARQLKMSCCDCCSVHVLDFRIRDGRIEMRINRDNRATMNKRRHTSVIARYTVAAQRLVMAKK
jgi:hypothetical protein